MGTTQEGRKACASTVGAAKARDAGDTGDVVHPCFTGAAYRIIALEYDGRRVGRMIVGPFLPANVVDAPASLMGVDPGIAPETARRHCFGAHAAREARDGHAHRRAPQGRARPHPVLRAQGARHEQDAPRERARELPPARGQDREAPGGVRPPEGARPAQVELPRDREPRAPDAAHLDHRLQRDARRGARRRAQARAAGVRQDDPRQGRAAPVAHHGAARSQQARERHDASLRAHCTHRVGARRGGVDADAHGAEEARHARARPRARSA